MLKNNITFIVSLILLIVCSVYNFVIISKNTQNTEKVVECSTFNGQNIISSKNRESVDAKKTVYLTFDDGPSIHTKEVLDILEENGVSATFFLIGNQINNNTLPIIKRMKNDGFQIGVHTYSHEPNEIYKSADSYYKDIMKTKKLIKKKAKITPTVFRFPYGSNNCYVLKYRKDIIGRLKEEGLDYCDWNVSGEDSIGKPSASQIIANVRNNYDVYNEPVVLLHDSGASSETVKALPTIIKMYKDAGYSFGIISDRRSLYQWDIK